MIFYIASLLLVCFPNAMATQALGLKEICCVFMEIACALHVLQTQ